MELYFDVMMFYWIKSIEMYTEKNLARKWVWAFIAADVCFVFVSSWFIQTPTFIKWKLLDRDHSMECSDLIMHVQYFTIVNWHDSELIDVFDAKRNFIYLSIEFIDSGRCVVIVNWIKTFTNKSGSKLRNFNDVIGTCSNKSCCGFFVHSYEECKCANLYHSNVY